MGDVFDGYPVFLAFFRRIWRCSASLLNLQYLPSEKIEFAIPSERKRCFSRSGTAGLAELGRFGGTETAGLAELGRFGHGFSQTWMALPEIAN